MSESPEVDEAVEILQELGLKEYEAKCYVALSRLADGTAKEVSDVSEVPRTRVYDATRVLESKGLVEVRHSNPQVFRAVDVDTAIRTLQSEYESRMASLREHLERVEPVQTAERGTGTNEMWTLSGATSIGKRLQEFIGDASEELRLLVGTSDAVSGEVTDALQAATQRGVSVVVGTVSDSHRRALEDDLPGIDVSVVDLQWFVGPESEGAILRRLLLVDGDRILVSTTDDSGEVVDEHATLGSGLDNGLVVVLRRVLAGELDPGAER